jgi:molecular chaperone GrpE
MTEHDAAETEESGNAEGDAVDGGADTDAGAGVDADAGAGEEGDLDADPNGESDVGVAETDSGASEAEAGAGAEGREEGRAGTETEAGSAEGIESEDIEELTERVGDASDEQVAREIASLRSLVADLEARGAAEGESEGEVSAEQVEELQSKLARKQADFENFKKRLNRRQEEERERATEDLVTRLLGVRDDLVRALDQEGDAEIRGGVESTLGELDRVLEDEGVAEIDAEPGTEVDPQRHEVMLRIDSDFPEGAIAEVFRPGYEMGGKVLRPAQVTVSEGLGNGDDDGDEGGGEDNGGEDDGGE